MTEGVEDINKVIGEIQYIPVEMPEWVSLPQEKLSNVLRKVNEYIEPVPFDPPPATVGRVRELPFYDDYYLLELTNLVSVPAYNKYAIMKPGDINIVDWTVEPIYSVNEKAPLKLTPGNVVSYLQFFSEYVFTADGQRFIINSPDDLPWVPSASEGQKARVVNHIRPAELTGVYEDGSFRVEVTDLALYDLHKSVIFVTPQGMVDWIVVDKVVEGLEIQRRDLLV